MFSLFLAAITLLPTVTLTMKCLPLDFAAEWSFESINSPEFKESFASLEPGYREDYCELHTVLEYRERVVRIRSINNSAENPDESISKSMIWSSIMIFPARSSGRLQTITTEHHVTTRCDLGDWCDRDILFYHINWLMEINYYFLMNEVSLLFIEQENTPGKD